MTSLSKKGPKGLANSVSWERNTTFDKHDSRASPYVLRTSHTDWDQDRTVRIYWRLTELEVTFESLKSELGLRPVWHRMSKQVAVHLFIVVLAIHGVNLIQKRLTSHGIQDS